MFDEVAARCPAATMVSIVSREIGSGKNFRIER
jgi:hypothetical protein